jgi:CRP-like cAMP-binding protein
MSNTLIQKLERRDTLSAAEREALERLTVRTQTYRFGETIVKQDEHLMESKVLQEGFAGRVKMMRNGRRQIVAVHITGDFVDLHSFVLKRLDHAIVALTPCRLASVDHADLQTITEQFPHLTRMLWLSTLIDGAMHRAWLAAMGGRSAAGQLAHFVCEMFVRLEMVGQTNGNSMVLPFTQPELGDILGLSSVHVNRVLQGLRGEGLLRWQDDVVTILDLPGLYRAAEFDPSYLSLQKEPR